jgi:4-hydroxy-3-methylbut-2-enyl diphosphate reductase
MKITKAKEIGFCGGVRWAVKKILELRKETDQPVHVFGELIHNKQFNQWLSGKDIHIAQNLEDCREKISVIRSHGLPPHQEENLRKNASLIMDLTCPRVKKVHSLVKDYSDQGYQIVITGNEEHPEVIGIRGYAENSYVIHNDEEAKQLELSPKMVLISQTTFSQEKFMKIAAILKKRKSDILIENTLCEATKNRQEEIKNLARENDLLIIIGGKHSSNTRKLRETALQEKKAAVYQIETAEDLREIPLKGVEKLAIASGASTPSWIIDEILKKMKKQGENEE